MQFDSSYITTAGSELFARATASANSSVSHPIVWGSVYTSKTDMRSLTQEEMRSLTSIPENERSSSGSVTSARHDIIDGNHIVKLECEINNRQYHGSAYAIGVYAKLDGDSNEILAAIARVDTSGSTPDIIQQSGEYLAIIDFAIAIRGDQFNIQKVDSSYYASAKSMQDLANRVVTTHVESDVTVGEDQDVRGNKYFQNGIMLNGQDGRSCIEFTDVYGRQDIACTVSISPQSHGIGISYGSHLFTDNDCILGMYLDDGSILYELTKKRVSYHVPDLYVDNVATNSITVDSGEDITLYANIIPYDDFKSIGTTVKPFNNIFATNANATNINANFVYATDLYVDNITTNAIAVEAGEDITLKANVVPVGDNVSVGTDTTPFNNIYATNANATNINANVVYVTDSISTDKLFSNTLNHEKVTTGSSGTKRQQLTTSYNKVQYSMTQGVQAGYSTMWMSDSTIGFTAGPHGNEYADDYTLMTMSIGEIQVRQPVTLFNNITVPSAKVSIENGYQIVTGIPLDQRTQHAAPNTNKYDATGINIGCLVGAYDTVESFTGSNAKKYLHPGTRITVRNGQIHVAMCAGAVNESAVNSWYPAGHNTNYSSPTGIEDLYLPEGDYVSCTAAVAQQATTEYVFVLLLRVA